MSKSGSLVARLEAEAARYGFLRTTGHGVDHHKSGWEVRCGKCPKIFTAYWSPAVPTEQMIKNMRKRHWDVGQGMRPLCPACAHSSDKAPNKRPEHQNFKPWAPPLPKTMIAASLLDGAVSLAMKTEKPPPSFDDWKAEQEAKEVPPSTLILDKAELGARILQRGELLDVLADAVADKNKAKSALYEAQLKRAARAREVKSQRATERKARKADEAVKEAIRIREIAEKAKAMPMEPKTRTQPSPNIMHTVFQLLDSVFDQNKRLYRAGYNDQRVAKDSGTTEDVVAKLRIDVYGELAEDPRIQAIKDDIALLEMQQADLTKNFATAIRDLNNRVDQLRSNLGR
jgi:hypothetical protein